MSYDLVLSTSIIDYHHTHELQLKFESTRVFDSNLWTFQTFVSFTEYSTAPLTICILK